MNTARPLHCLAGLAVLVLAGCGGGDYRAAEVKECAAALARYTGADERFLLSIDGSNATGVTLDRRPDNTARVLFQRLDATVPSGAVLIGACDYVGDRIKVVTGADLLPIQLF